MLLLEWQRTSQPFLFASCLLLRKKDNISLLASVLFFMIFFPIFGISQVYFPPFGSQSALSCLVYNLLASSLSHGLLATSCIWLLNQTVLESPYEKASRSKHDSHHYSATELPSFPAALWL